MLPSWASALGLHYILKVVGRAFGLFGIDTGGDRRSLRLRPNDEKLVEAVVAAVGHNTILGIEASGAVIFPPEARGDCAVILWTGHQGCEFGNGLQDVLWGRSEPSGRLPFVIPGNRGRSSRMVTVCQEVHLRPMVRIPATAEDEAEGSVSFRIRVGIWRCPDPSWSDRSKKDYERVLVGFAKKMVKPNEKLTVKVACRLNPISHRNSAMKRLELAPGRYAICAARYEGDPDSVNQVVEIASMVIG